MLEPLATKTPSHRWRFFRAGGFDQVRLDRGADLVHLGELDQKLWVALSCPTRGIEFDPQTLDFIDTDKDGRIRVPELLAAVRWATGLLNHPDELLAGTGKLPLAALNEGVPEAAQLLRAARQILEQLGKKDAPSIELADTSDLPRVFAQTKFNGDGIVPAEATDDAALRALIADVMACLGPETDRSGKPGVSLAKVDQFFGEAQAFVDWARKGADAASGVQFLGEGTAAADAAFRAVRAKVDDYFARCRLVAFDVRALPGLNRDEKEYAALGVKDLTLASAEIVALPLARVEAGRPLPLTEGINPAWAGAVARLAADAIRPWLGERQSITESEWNALGSKLGGYEAWVASQPKSSVDKLGRQRLEDVLAGAGKEALAALIARDKALEPEFTAIAQLVKLLRFHRDLITLLNNFVNFRDFYDPEKSAAFQAGTLFLDQRGCDLCVQVADPGKHVALAGLAKTYLAYCDCTRPGGEKMTIAAAFTGGDADYLMVGRNGVFYDRKGRDWDATITKVVENPISIRQAFWAPYKKLVRLIEEQVAKRAAAAEQAADAKVAGAATAVAHADKAKPAEPKKVDVGTVAALGVAFGAIGTMFATLAGYLTGMLTWPFWMVCVAFAGLLLLISGPSMLIAWLKLRQRNLGPILDANGWAVNGRVRINVPFGGSLTSVAKLPPGSQAALDDRFAEPPSVWPKLLAGVVAVAFLYSLLNHFGLIPRFGPTAPAGSTPATIEPAAPAGASADTNPPAA